MALGRSIFEAVLTITLFDNYIAPTILLLLVQGSEAKKRNLVEVPKLSGNIIQIDKEGTTSTYRVTIYLLLIKV